MLNNPFASITQKTFIFPIFTSLFIAFLLSIFPLYDYLAKWRPLFTMTIICYWLIFFKHHINIFVAWFCGLLADILFSTLLGQYALCYSLAFAFLSYFGSRLRYKTIIIQMIFVAITLLIMQLLFAWICILTKQAFNFQNLMEEVLASVIFYPILYLIMKRFARKYKWID